MNKAIEILLSFMMSNCHLYAITRMHGLSPVTDLLQITLAWLVRLAPPGRVHADIQMSGRKPITWFGCLTFVRQMDDASPT